MRQERTHQPQTLLQDQSKGLPPLPAGSHSGGTEHAAAFSSWGLLVFVTPPAMVRGTLQAQNRSLSPRQGAQAARPRHSLRREIAEITPSVSLLYCMSVFPVLWVNTGNIPFCDSSPTHHVLTQLPAPVPVTASPPASSPLPCPLILHPRAAMRAQAMTVSPCHKGLREEVELLPGFQGGEGDGRDGGASSGSILCWGRKKEAWGHSAITAGGHTESFRDTQGAGPT